MQWGDKRTVLDKLYGLANFHQVCLAEWGSKWAVPGATNLSTGVGWEVRQGSPGKSLQKGYVTVKDGDFVAFKQEIVSSRTVATVRQGMTWAWVSREAGVRVWSVWSNETGVRYCWVQFRELGAPSSYRNTMLEPAIIAQAAPTSAQLSWITSR